MPHHAVFLFSSLQIKSFWSLLLESTCAFILRAGSRTLYTWNSCVCHLCIIFGDHKGLVFTWGQYRLCQTGKGCLGTWPWLSGTLIESVLQENPPSHGLATADLSGWPFLSLSLSLSLIKEGFPLGNLRKSSKPITVVRQAAWENSGAGWKLILDWPMLHGQSQTSVHWGFFPLNSLLPPSLNYLPFKVWPT
jgi:hypothetical protein